MKTAIVVLIGAVLVTGIALAGAAEFLNCGLCKPLVSEPGLMDHIQWETYEIATGMLSVTTVAPEYEEAYTRAHSKMMESVKRLESGEKLELCSHCQRMSDLAAAGARIENVDTKGGHIMAVTASSPALIEKIHEHARWAKEQHAAKAPEHHCQGG